MSNTTILVIEDEPSLSEVLRDKFFNNNYTVVVARDGVAGLAQAISQHPSIILLDLTLPGMNGLELLEKLRTDEWGANVPVVILSNQDGTEAIMHGVEQKAQAYFIKADTSLETICAAIEDLIGGRPSSQSKG
jgi:DNA-binding response OmpR family regulator